MKLEFELENGQKIEGILNICGHYISYSEDTPVNKIKDLFDYDIRWWSFTQSHEGYFYFRDKKFREKHSVKIRSGEIIKLNSCGVDIDLNRSMLMTTANFGNKWVDEKQILYNEKEPFKKYLEGLAWEAEEGLISTQELENLKNGIYILPEEQLLIVQEVYKIVKELKDKIEEAFKKHSMDLINRNRIKLKNDWLRELENLKEEIAEMEKVLYSLDIHQ